MNETVQGNLSYSPGIFTTNYTYLTPHDESIPYYLVYLICSYPTDLIDKFVFAKNYYYTTLPPTESFNVTYSTQPIYYFVAQAKTNKYTSYSLIKLVGKCFTINEENNLVYWPMEMCGH